MQGIGGFATCERIRATENGKYVPLVMVTSLEERAINRTQQLKAANSDLKKRCLNYKKPSVNW